MRQQKKSKVEVLTKKLNDIKAGKWTATEKDIFKLEKSLSEAKMQEGSRIK